MESMGANMTVALAASKTSIAISRYALSGRTNCFTVMQMKSMRKMKKYCTVRFITHCMAGEIGGVRETSVGCSMMKTEYITAEKPPYRAIRQIQRMVTTHMATH